MSEVVNIPQLRFSEFNGNWEEVPFYDCLIDILDFRGRTPLKIGMDWGGGNIISLSANNVKNGYIDFNAECHLGSEELYEKWMGKVKLVKNDIVFTMEAPLGKALLVPDDERYILSQRVVAFKTRGYIDNLYFIQLIWNNKFQNIVHRLSTGSTAKGINQKSLKKVFINIPLKPEQQKIAAFLTTVDTKIELLSKKQALLCEYKKGLMQQIFSQVIRFKADDGCDFLDWEEKRLDDVGSFKSGTGFTEIEQGGKSGVPFFKVSDMNLEGNQKVMVSANNYVNDEQIERLNYKPLNQKSVIFAKVGAAVFLERKRVADNFLIDNNMMAFTPTEDIDFIRQWFDTVRLSKYAQVGALPSYNASDLKTIKINLPSLQEQIKIANFLSLVDNKIEQVDKQLDESKQFKKALLQQMFV